MSRARSRQKTRIGSGGEKAVLATFALMGWNSFSDYDDDGYDLGICVDDQGKDRFLVQVKTSKKEKFNPDAEYVCAHVSRERLNAYKKSDLPVFLIKVITSEENCVRIFWVDIKCWIQLNRCGLSKSTQENIKVEISASNTLVINGENTNFVNYVSKLFVPAHQSSEKVYEIISKHNRYLNEIPGIGSDFDVSVSFNNTERFVKLSTKKGSKRSPTDVVVPSFGEDEKIKEFLDFGVPASIRIDGLCDEFQLLSGVLGNSVSEVKVFGNDAQVLVSLSMDSKSDTNDTLLLSGTVSEGAKGMHLNLKTQDGLFDVIIRSSESGVGVKIFAREELKLVKVSSLFAAPIFNFVNYRGAVSVKLKLLSNGDQREGQIIINDDRPGLFSDLHVLPDLTYVCKEMKSKISFSDIINHNHIDSDVLFLAKDLLSGKEVGVDWSGLSLNFSSSIAERVAGANVGSFRLMHNLDISPFNGVSLGKLPVNVFIKRPFYSLRSNGKVLVVDSAEFTLSMLPFGARLVEGFFVIPAN